MVVGTRQPITLPVEVWKEVADHMTTKQWAKVSGTCRAMSKVPPRRIQCQPWGQTPEHLLDMVQWCINHWREAEKLAIKFGDVHMGKLSHLLWDCSPSEHLQQLAFDFSPSREAEGKWDYICLDKYASIWLKPFLRQAAQLEALCLEGISDKFPDLPVLDKLVHLAVGFRRPLKKDACSALQTLHSLETLCLDILFTRRQYESEDVVQISGLDLTGCSKLRAVRVMMLEPEFLRLPPGCSLSVTRDIIWLDEDKWQTTAGVMCACSLRANALQGEEEWERYQCGRLQLSLSWLSRFPCPNLTRLDIDYPELSHVWMPIRINGHMANLQHLRISSLNVYLYICAPVRLQTLIVAAEQSLNLDVVDIDALAANLTTVQLRWISCCPTTAKFAALFRARGEYIEGEWSGYTEDMEPNECHYDWTTKLGFPEFSFVGYDGAKLSDLCACGVCYACCTRSMHLWRRNASWCCHFV